MEKIYLSGRLTLDEFISAVRGNVKVELSDNALPKINACRDIVEDIVANKRAVYGITTGFGKFSEVSISDKDSKTLQKNLILSHACGVGQPLDDEVVKGMMILRVNALSVGHSGIRTKVLELLIDMINNNIIPVVPSQGSLGASGDLVPLAHMSLPLLGLGLVRFQGEVMPTEQAFEKSGLRPIELTSKEGLALINGTQAMNSLASLSVFDACNLLKTADIATALTMEALNSVIDAFDIRIHKIRKQKGQENTALNINKLLSDSKRITRQGEKRIQDPYTIRCVPQVHGSSKDGYKYVRQIVENEINAVTDNPLIFPDSGDVLSGGNFHGQYLSSTMDFLAIVLSSLAGISERRIERLVNPQLSFGLPAFLVKNGGLNSGFMIPQYTAAALVSENKVLSHPASVDSITSSANQEDYVSMGMTAARKARKVVQNTANVLAIELFAAAQAVEFDSAPLAPATKAVFDLIRSKVEFVENDKFLAPEIEKISKLVISGEIVKAAEDVIGELLI